MRHRMRRPLGEDSLDGGGATGAVKEIMLDQENHVDKITNAAARTVAVGAAEGMHLLRSVTVDVNEVDRARRDPGEAETAAQSNAFGRLQLFGSRGDVKLQAVECPPSDGRLDREAPGVAPGLVGC